MAVCCGVCEIAGSKYKCPTCELRYCSIACYKPHKATHESQTNQVPGKAPKVPSAQPQAPVHRPGTKSRAPKLDFTTLQTDPEFKHLLARYPALILQLQAIYGLTLDPGPDDARTWNRGPLPSLDRPQSYFQRGRGRGGRGSRGGRGGRGGGRGGGGNDAIEERQHGAWTREKGDKEALLVLKKMREGGKEDERAEGLREFGRLVGLRFGGARDGEESE